MTFVMLLKLPIFSWINPLIFQFFFTNLYLLKYLTNDKKRVIVENKVWGNLIYNQKKIIFK
jgi:hypothetical protein